MCKWVCHLLHQPTPSHPWVSRRWGPISTALTRRAGQRVQPTRYNKFHSTTNLFPTPLTQYVHCFLFLERANSWVYDELKRARSLQWKGRGEVQAAFRNGTLSNLVATHRRFGEIYFPPTSGKEITSTGPPGGMTVKFHEFLP